MQPRPVPVVTTWPFVASLGLLIVNDAWLKSAYPGWLTGKLSDVTGIAVVGLLLLSARPRSRAVAAGFAWWKSAWSGPAIAAINAWLPFTVGRTIDPTDLLALFVLVLCGPVAVRPEAFALPSFGTPGPRRPIARRWLRVPLLGLTAFALAATSRLEGHQKLRIYRPDGGSIHCRPVAEAIVQAAKEQDIACEGDFCGAPSYTASCHGDLWFDSYFSSPGSGPETMILDVGYLPEKRAVRGKDEEVDRLRNAIQRQLTPLATRIE